ncbi:MAG TPA: nickel pincer cofactor biosynthesis protein LarC [Myxococcota bacterium]|nr:nickel pincer cofactor biosynthesis protein LarC [Myxococcota bacterium]HRY95634.1 nickel pincer cofactor biosynthesis protein LarC [Myxococcota bacterium]HSA20341.1 nickel pincer cofactor biosynthesis protein LarC [Myxococcota bacterium]
MRVLHFDMPSGIAGDMALAALTQLGAPLEPLQAALQAMGLAGVRVGVEPAEVSGIAALRLRVEEPGPHHPHDHRSYRDIRALLGRAGLPAGARARAEDMFARLAAAEGRVHGRPADEVTFHEVGAVDSIADLLGVALALEHLAPARVTASPPVVGHGVVQCQHGPLPLPAPATLELLKGIQLRGLDVEGELTTPTGAAILASQVHHFTAAPALAPSALGHGAGTRSLPGRPNVLRVLLGEGPETPAEDYLLEANLDDMPPTLLEHLLERLLAAGAFEAWLQPVVMKRSRPAVVVACLCAGDRLAALEGVLLRESTSLGLRRRAVERRKLARRAATVETPWGPVRVKLALEGERLLHLTPEYEDCRALAERAGVPLLSVDQAARAAWRVEEREP